MSKRMLQWLDALLAKNWSRRTGRLARLWDRLSFTNPFASKPHEHGGDDEEGNGVHAITKKTDYWFNRELNQIEQEAKQLAAEWADKGLPRHDVERAGVLEPEQVLGMNASSCSGNGARECA